LFGKKKKNGLQKGIKVGRKEVEVCILQFAYNTLFLVKSEHHNILTLNSILGCFELASRLKVNFYKSKIDGIDVSDDILNRYTKMLNYNVMSLPFTNVNCE